MRCMLVLQIAIYYNIFLSLAWLATHACGLPLKYASLSDTNRFLAVAGYSSMFLLDFPRLWLGYMGNLFRRPALLMAFWLITILIHFPIQAFLLFAPGMKQRAIEVVMDAIVFLFLLVEVASGLLAVRKSILIVMSDTKNKDGAND